MSKLVLTIDTFKDLVVLFLFDQMTEYFLSNRDTSNLEFEELLESLNKKGAIPILHKYFITMDAGVRSKYMMFAKIFEENEIGFSEVVIKKGKKNG